ncbi:hypothetical protein LCGC14_1567140 [marine sediment metagenome]|uniref:Uncharacterized protein n=1 Tax=marine sediment metagenome TaxID=412755 RepID=A0A0F9IKQ6_9ZZZZ
MAGEDQTAVCLTHIADRLDSIDGRQIEHGKTLAVLDERSQQHEKRMNRADRRGGYFGAGAGGILATVVIGLRMWFGRDQP